jgi:dihydrofolate synthase/folylpolyglutamate synthase
MRLQELLDSKPLYYTKFDPNRIVKAYDLIKDKINHPKAIQLIGTNGKGSTGRAVAHLASKSGLSVGHFSSPHILDFKERFWIDGKFASLNMLEVANKKLYNLLGEDMAQALSYFEYQALLAFVLYENLDLQVIETGLGGEFDATSVKSYNLSIITPIGLDHADFLGNTIKEVASTKLNAMSPKALIAKQQNQEVYTIAKDIANKKGAKLYFYKDLANLNVAKVQDFALKKAWPEYLVQNITNATLALDILDIKYNLSDLESLELFGRFYKLKSNIILDVGHNMLAANAISKAIDGKINLIFNILNDKNYTDVLKELKEKIEHLYIIKIETQRATQLNVLEKTLKELNIKYSYFDGNIQDNKNYLVFGSFYVVEAFLKEIDIKEIKA